MSQTQRTLQDAYTSLTPSEALKEAKKFFLLQNGIYTAFLDMEGPNFVTLRGQGGEEIAVGVSESAQGTRVTASTYLFDQQVAQFLSGLPKVKAAPATLPAPDAAEAPIQDSSVIV